MALDRGILAKVDRRVFVELGQAATTQAVKIPLSDAAWSTWRRYCRAIGLTMGEAIAGLIEHELRRVVAEFTGADDAPSAARREEELAARESELVARQRRLSRTSQGPAKTEAAGGKVGRNQRCPCGSGRKYKRCHGSADRRQQRDVHSMTHGRGDEGDVVCPAGFLMCVAEARARLEPGTEAGHVEVDSGPQRRCSNSPRRRFRRVGDAGLARRHRRPRSSE